MVIILLFVELYIIQFSIDLVLLHGFARVVVNLAFFAMLLGVLIIITGRYYLAALVSMAIIFLISVVNYFIIMYHGSPLTASVLLQVGAAGDVASGYSFHFDSRIGILAMGAVLGGLISIAINVIEKRLSIKKRTTRLSGIVIAIFAGILIFWGLFGPSPVKPNNTFDLSVYYSMCTYGFFPCQVEDVGKLTGKKVIKPEGYDVSDTEELLSKYVSDSVKSENTTTPDIIIILNETWYDLEHYADIETDIKVFDSLATNPNTYTGFVTVPGTGGGTNNSEYELLTSNSMSLLPLDAPFITLDISGANSIVSYLESLGYNTWGMHSGFPATYSRELGYKLLGFDHVLVGDAFPDNSKYGNRIRTDAQNYKDLIEIYNSAGDSPQFMFLLTFQNHGGYQQNDESMDQVHVKGEYSVNEDILDEYLTSIKMTVDAWNGLVEYFSNEDRKVILCMVGDHAPSFITDLIPSEKDKPDLAEIDARQTPFVLWTNIANGASVPKALSMTDLVPQVLQTAGLPLSAYYKCILELSSEIPVRMREGLYIDAEDQMGNFLSGSVDNGALSDYFALEYLNLTTGKSYPELFTIKQ